MSDSDFELWFPRWGRSGDQTTLTFDVVWLSWSLLHEGTAELGRSFLEAWGLPEDELRGWRIERLCTPFFTELTENEDWRDRYRISWRVELRIAGGPRELAPGPVEVIGYDDTGVPEPSSTAGVETCEVIAAGTDPELEARLRARFPDAWLSVHEVTEDGQVYRIGRLAQGTLDVEEHLAELDAIRDACRELGLVTDLPGFERLRAGA
ncbi:hypothetical protein [Actinoplanes sp. NBRC 103695]|uniref:hypothetical protein n=1 Tax=Actinoplanes sp. NBRC 103695 TaxID=3032202 RepID=UPI0025568344|nr:hypothetical protein [Actinoplanes sp. NBRC 103695]